MKSKNYLYFLIILLMANACKKHPTDGGKFAGTTYQTLGTYDTSGKPANLLKDTISSSLLSFIDSTLPNQKDLRISHPEFFKSSAIADIIITQSSDVYLTFVSQGGNLTNTLAFYTYPTNQPPASAAAIKLITYVFPNSGYLTALRPGDKVKIGRFEAGTSVGFVLLQGSWNPATHTINNKVAHFCTTDVLNPETDPNLQKHAVLINYIPEKKLLVSFEDTDRTRPDCDNDFNDVVVYCTVK